MFVACFCDKYSSDAFFLSHLLVFTVSICVSNEKKTKSFIFQTRFSVSSVLLGCVSFCVLKIYILNQSPVTILSVVRIIFPLIFYPSFLFMCHQRPVTELYHTFSVYFYENHKNTLNYYRCHFNGLRLKIVYDVRLLEYLAAAIGKTLD